jgi:hypothetical protein
MRTGDVYLIPQLKIESVEWKKEYTMPATAIVRIPTKPGPKRRNGSGMGRRARPSFRVGDARREMRLDLFYGVDEIAAIGVEQWDLVHGAELVKSGKRYIAKLQSELPTRAITVDLYYPMAKIARVTVRPYKYGTQRKMTIGYLLWQLARAYDTIYGAPFFWGVRNHDISDLRFVDFELDDNIGKVSVCS